MSTVDAAASVNGAWLDGASPELAELLDRQAEHRSRATAVATRQLVTRLNSSPRISELRDDLEDALVDVAAHAVQALIKLREQRGSESNDVAEVCDSLEVAATALRTAELTTAVMRSVASAR